RARLYRLAQQAQEDLRRSRDQLVAILGGIAEGITVQDASGRLVYANDVAAQMTGFTSASELLATPPEQLLDRFALFDEAGMPLPFDQLPGRRLLLGQPSSEIVVRFRDANTHEQRWSILDAAPVADEHGRLQLVVNIFRDVTERKRQADATAFLAEASSVLSASLDAEATLERLAQLAVPALVDICLVDLVEDRGRRRIVEVYAESEQAVESRQTSPLPALLAAIERVVRSGGPELLADGSAVVAPMRVRATTLGVIALAMHTSGRRFNAVDLGLVEDLAARAALAVDNARLFREAQEQAEHQAMLNAALRSTIDERDRALGDLRQALRTRDEFLASASHDLKNPLASIKATAQLMLRRLDRFGVRDLEQLRDGLQRLDAIATRAAAQVEELLDVARMQMGRPLDLDLHPIDLAALTRDVVAEHQQTTERHELRLESEAELIGAFDISRLRRVLNNLVDNAIKYSPQGGDVIVRLGHEPADTAVLEVEDHGLGIPATDVSRIFDRFQRASNVEGRFAGTGIGLASARHIVESHAGSIEVDSREGAGTLFRVRLPLRSAPAAGDVE
ncbi:MAG TPA: ATP-binding protein, partial [Chloroflexota bacterium]|nr:ATP-binding protein [Chloroflexota bacterium]